VQPTETVVKEIRTGLQTLGTFTSSLRLMKNTYTVSGEAVLNAYALIAARQGVKNPGAWDPNGKLVGNAARLLHADSSMVEATTKYLKDFHAKVQAEVDPKTGLVPPEKQKALAQEFKKGMPDMGAGFDAADVSDPKHMAARFFRGLGAACFLGSALNNGKNASNEAGITSSDVFAGLFGAGAAIDTYRAMAGKSFSDSGKVVDWLQQTRFGDSLTQKAGQGAVGDLVKMFKDGGLGSLISVADVMWMYEDFAGEPIWASDKSNPGDPTAGLLTAGIVAGDALDLAALGLRTQVGRTALTAGLTYLGAETAAVSVQAALPVIGWAAAAVTTAFLVARFAYGVSDAKNKFEFGDDDPAGQRYVQMARDLGFTDPQLKALLNNNGGDYEQDVKDWEWFIPGWNTVRAVEGAWKAGDSFFTEGGVSPMHVLNAVFDHNQVPQQQRLQYLQSLSDGEISNLVGKTHEILDHDMGDDGRIDGADCEKIEAWMRENRLWKPTYLGQ